MLHNSLDFGQTLSNIAHFGENGDPEVQPVFEFSPSSRDRSSLRWVRSTIRHRGHGTRRRSLYSDRLSAGSVECSPKMLTFGVEPDLLANPSYVIAAVDIFVSGLRMVSGLGFRF
jgi:hypothetical protein